ncbi:unnamed protein product [Mycena citricolor]|uniref:Anaphase-promoting complex subunit 1 n=1 Tax=Mycena citricolor TaxID=2018698 RepID=A0AAD2K000_9AGAR|nr:unnamed protein product [Mycena citricolor]
MEIAPTRLPQRLRSVETRDSTNRVKLCGRVFDKTRMEPCAIAVPLSPENSSAAHFLSSHSPTAPFRRRSSKLLTAIHAALGSGPSKVHHSSFAGAHALPGDGPWEEDEIIWNKTKVVWLSGGVIRKQWTFIQEGQAVQFATLGWLEQDCSTGDPFISPLASDSQDKPLRSTATDDSSERPTFGPFAQLPQNAKLPKLNLLRVPAAFVFLRDIGKIFLKNGTDYTFAVPFVVRQAWPLYPHGVLIQRSLEPGEIEEAAAIGETALPTIFSLTSPFAEAVAMGLTSGILNGFGEAPTLKDEEEHSQRPLKAVPSTDNVIWTSRRGPGGNHDLVVSVDVATRQLSIWRYVFIKPNDTPVPFGQAKVAKHRHSLSIATNRRTSTMFTDFDRLNPRSPKPVGPRESAMKVSDVPVLPGDMPPFSALPGMPPALSATTMAPSGSGTSSQWSGTSNRHRRNSLTRNDLSVTMDRMALGAGIKSDFENTLPPPSQHGRMKTSYWMEKLYSKELSDIELVLSSCTTPILTLVRARNWQEITCSQFDRRWDGASYHSLLSVHTPVSGTLLVMRAWEEDDVLKVALLSETAAIAATSLRITRKDVWDLLVLRANSQFVILTHGLRELPVQLSTGNERVVDLKQEFCRSATFIFQSGRRQIACIDLVPTDSLTLHTLETLSLILPSDLFFELHHCFLVNWSRNGLRASDNVQFECLTAALCTTFELDRPSPSVSTAVWSMLGVSPSHDRFREDIALRNMRRPSAPLSVVPCHTLGLNRRDMFAPVLYALHALAENLRLRVDHYKHVNVLAPIICRFAQVIRPEWADYWKRLVPDAMAGWPEVPEHEVDDRLPVWPPDLSAILYGRVSSPDWQVPWHDTQHIANRFHIEASYAFGHVEPLATLRRLNMIYNCLADHAESSSQRRAENAVLCMVQNGIGSEFVNRLSLGVSMPVREASRTCQVAPPSEWPLEAYRAVGRNDIAASASQIPDMVFADGYRPIKEFVNPTRPRPTIQGIVTQAKVAGLGAVETVSGVELGLKDFTDIRFGQDRRLDEVARLLCSSKILSVRAIERPELNEHDQSKEHQHQVLRISERTLALPYGRAIFTFGTLMNVTKEAYSIPKLEFSIKLQPLGVTVTPEPGKLHGDSLSWGEFHNGVAAGLRISPSAAGVESSWIAFNRPSELTPEHAGFLFALGLTGHLKTMLTWHTFAYLTPKHDLTSIGVLLGLAAANVGTGDEHVTKLLAVHTPALLPTPEVDLNVPLMTQAAGLSGLGLLYMGTKNRRMAEVCLGEIARRDLADPDLNNEFREAYTFSAALAFGMIMLGKGSMVPADAALLSRLNILIHGEPRTPINTHRTGSFDLNLTSPAATLALGLMYLRTERQDVADMLVIPDTVLALNRIQPSFLLMRVLAKALIMWDSISPTSEWQAAQIPRSIREAVDNRSRKGVPIDDSLELAYYNILAASCFAIGLKFAGTARQEAYMMIIRYFDLFTRMVYSNSQAFDHKIRRSAVRDGLNLISIALSMVMAGTGEISCLRRFRFAYGMYHQTMYHPAFRYGIHVANHMSLGLLFIGGGRFTLGTSDAAVACMVTALFPRAHHASSENKSFLQALRHLWVLAIEPRCLIARDVETTDVVYLPVKITVHEGREAGTTQLISPTLIPDLDKLAAIRVDTPRYWPFHFDTANIPRHKDSLLRSQTLYVKRRTAFLSYTEDPRGSRSLFVRSRSSAGEAATLDFPQLSDTKVHPASDLGEFITSFSNDTLFLAYADHLAREEGVTEAERILHIYSHANLLDSILQGKPQTLQAHLTLFRFRLLVPNSRYFHLHLQDLRFAADFYSKIYERRFSGRRENNYRIPLLRDSTVSGTLHVLDEQLRHLRADEQFKEVLKQYASGEPVSMDEGASSLLAWYLLRNSVPVSTLLMILKHLANEAFEKCFQQPQPAGTIDQELLKQGITEVLHAAGVKLTTVLGAGWSVGLAEGNGAFSNYHLAALVLLVPYVVKSFVPLVNRGGLKTYLVLMVLTGVPTTIAYWTLMSTYGGRKNEKVLFPGKDIEEYITIKDPELKKLYYGKNKIPMQVFHDAYFEGKIDFNGDVLDVLEQRHDWAKFTFTPELFKYVFLNFLPEVIVHSQSQDEEQVRDHYDRGDDFYEWFLGPRMIYTSGVILSPDQFESLETLQDNKLAIVCNKLNLQPTDRLLDVGCGWGTLVAYAAKNFGCDVTGVTLGKNQTKFGTKRIADNGISADKARILCCDYREIPHGKGIYDKIVSLEMAEHVGVRRYSAFLGQMYELLSDDGIFVFQVAGLRQGWQFEDLIWGLFMNKYVFPGADASASLGWVVNKLEQANFEVKSIDVLGVHYSATLWRWYLNWLSNKEKVIEKYGERWFRIWAFFLAWSTIASRQGTASVFQFVLHKNLNAYHRVLGAANHGGIHVKLDKEPHEPGLTSVVDTPGDEPCAKIWSVYLSEAEKYDRDLVESWRANMNGMLIFAGLFSAVLTAFIIQSYQSFTAQMAPAQSPELLALIHISQQIAPNGFGSAMLPLALDFTGNSTLSTPGPDAAYLACNILWYLSLGLSLASALLATLVDQWAREFLQRAEMRPNPVKRARMYAYLYYGLQRFRMHVVVGVVPLLLHYSLFLFFGGLVAFLKPVNFTLTIIAVAMLGFVGIFYASITLLPLLWFDCPYQTPLSPLLWNIHRFLLRRILSHFPAPARQNADDPQPPLNPHLKSQQSAMLDTATIRSDLREARDKRALAWTMKSLADDDELEPFVEGIPNAIYGPQGRRVKYDDLMLGLLKDPDVLLGSRIEHLLLSCDAGLLEPLAQTRRLHTCLKAIWCLGMIAEKKRSPAQPLFFFQNRGLKFLPAPTPAIAHYLPSISALAEWNGFCSLHGHVAKLLEHLENRPHPVMPLYISDCRLRLRLFLDQYELSNWQHVIPIASEGKNLALLVRPPAQPQTTFEMDDWVTDVKHVLQSMPLYWNKIQFRILHSYLQQSAALDRPPYEFQLTCQTIQPSLEPDIDIAGSVASTISETVHRAVSPSGRPLNHIDIILGILLPWFDTKALEPHIAVRVTDSVIEYINHRESNAAVCHVLGKCDLTLLWDRITDRINSSRLEVSKAMWHLSALFPGPSALDARLAEWPAFNTAMLDVIPAAPYTASVLALLKSHIYDAYEAVERTLLVTDLKRFRQRLIDNPVSPLTSHDSLTLLRNVERYWALMTAVCSLLLPPVDTSGRRPLEKLPVFPVYRYSTLGIYENYRRNAIGAIDKAIELIPRFNRRMGEARFLVFLGFVNVCAHDNVLPYKAFETLSENLLLALPNAPEMDVVHPNNQRAFVAVFKSLCGSEQTHDLVTLILTSPLFIMEPLHWLDDPESICALVAILKGIRPNASDSFSNKVEEIIQWLDSKPPSTPVVNGHAVAGPSRLS